jgi:hypothetical protein
MFVALQRAVSPLGIGAINSIVWGSVLPGWQPPGQLSTVHLTVCRNTAGRRRRLETKFQEVAAAKGEAARARSALEGWQNAFRDECKGMEPEPGAVLDALLTLRAAERKAGEAQRDAKKREAALLLRVQAKEAEMLELKVRHAVRALALGFVAESQRESRAGGRRAQGRGCRVDMNERVTTLPQTQELCHWLLLQRVK